MRAAVVTCAVMVAGAAVPARSGSPASDPRRTPVVEVFEKSHDAVVNIATTRVQRVRSLLHGSLFDEIFFGHPLIETRPIQSVGSGFVVHESGYIVTNAHVVAQATDIRVSLADDRTFRARIVAVDPDHDLAVIKIDAPEPLTTIRLAPSDEILIGETVVAIGNALGYRHTVTTGIVSAVNRDLQFGRDFEYTGLIQTDAAINPGNSGGPLLNLKGELIGVNTAIRGDAQNVGFAIPVRRVWELLPVMLDIERRQRVRFGLRVAGPEAKVVAIRDASPAARSGLKPGDRVTRVDGQRIGNAIDFYVQMLKHKPGDEVRIDYTRDQGDREEATVPLEVIPPPDGSALAKRLLGMDLDEFPPAIRRRYDLPDDVGLLVSDVRPRGPADRAGIMPGDLIVRVDRIPVPTLDDVGLALEGVDRGQRLIIEGIRVRADPPYRWIVQLRTAR